MTQITTSYTQAQLTALEGAIASGALEVSYSDRRVRYRSLSEMMKIATDMRIALGIQTAATTPAVLYAEFRAVGDE